MTFLAPGLLALGVVVAVPLLLHLFQRHQGPRMVFPALRYLRKAEREHATRIRLRQWLLLALRVLAILLLAAAAARPLLPVAGPGHRPTAVVLVLDNSLSTGAVSGERRVLDELRDVALRTVDAAEGGDRIWVIRAGTPWEPALGGTFEEARSFVRTTDVSGAAADLASALERARAILERAPPGLAREIHLISDLQASSFPRAVPGAGGATTTAPAVRVYVPTGGAPPNRWVADVTLGGGLPPRSGERTTAAIALAGAEAEAGGAGERAVRLVVDGTVRGAGRTSVGATTVLPFPAHATGWATGFAETDPDALRADDRRYFATRVLPPVPVAAPGAGPFLEEALAALESAGRVRRTAVAEAEVVIAPGARSADAVRRGVAVLVLPPGSPVELGAANGRLADAGIPWRFGEPRRGEGQIDTTASDWSGIPGGVRLRTIYDLVPAGPGDSALARLRGGEPWAVAGPADGGGRYVVLATPLTAEGGTLPTSAAMVPLLDRAIARWARTTDPPAELAPGDRIVVEGDAVVGPAGAEPVPPGSAYRFPDAGIYRVMAGTDTLVAYAVNPPSEESRLERIQESALRDRLAERDVNMAGPDGWPDAIFHDRAGREATTALLAALLLLLAVETAVAATGRARATKAREA